jgi:hypothetical protein
MILKPFVVFTRFCGSLLQTRTDSDCEIVPVCVSPALATNGRLEATISTESKTASNLVNLFVFINSPPHINCELFMHHPADESDQSSCERTHDLLKNLHNYANGFTTPIYSIIKYAIILSQYL